MVKFFGILLTGVLTSFFFFPFEFSFLPGINVKMMLAVLGLAFAAYELIRRRSIEIPLELLLLAAFAVSVSLASLVSMTLNQTPDNTYATYIISFFVWLNAAFAVCCCIRAVHGRIDVRLVLDYLVVICVFQCVISLVIDGNPTLARWVNSTFEFGQQVTIDTKRLYGIGALLDVAGARYSAVLVGLAFYLSEVTGSLNTGRRIFYILAFGAISVIGNMMARTTLVGMIIGLVFIVVGIVFRPSQPGQEGGKTHQVLTWVVILTIGVIVSIVLYDTNSQARKLFRFGFEGFFSLAEKGRWEVSSNEKLKTMVVFPETLHTWVIGDGYFENSRNDPNYLGDATNMGYYMGTDVGYLRFIFYFGVPGLLCMMSVIIGSAIVCTRHFQKEKWLFIMALLVGLAVWLKVSTDIFCFFAMFLSAAALHEEEPEEELLQHA